MGKVDSVSMEEISTIPQGIHAMESLVTISKIYINNWFVGGDFNEVLKSMDKFGGNPVNPSCSNLFWDCLNECKLLDLSYKGSKFTWTNKRYTNKTNLILERIDRYFANESWTSQYPEATVIHLSRTHSDHCHIQVVLKGDSLNNSTKPFRFQSMWTSHPSFSNIINEAFTPNFTLIQSTKSFKRIVTQWNRNTFGNIFHKKRILARITGIQKSPNYQFNSYLLNLETNLTNELDSILKNEEDLWKLKSRINWLNNRDANTRFFHSSTLNRRIRNRILSLKEESGYWLYDQGGIKTSIFSFFKNLYTSSQSQAPISTTNHIDMTHTISDSLSNSLNRPLKMGEIKLAILSFKSFKTPGPDGLHPLFYQKYWSIVGNSVIDFCKQCFTTKSMDDTMNQTLLCLIPKCPKLPCSKTSDELDFVTQSTSPSLRLL
ncbi:uncharacterized protein LOC142170186 [Nicotiana tabacum]|uniref:Uncharacterized protein LOC142170186 n=1 Tax=Nicotiana tabacum TaxID=4097 RepID=A0AC58ST34_TOBAC